MMTSPAPQSEQTSRVDRPADGPSPTARGRAAEPTCTMPAGAMIAISAGLPALLGSAWWLAASAASLDTAVALSGAAGALVTAISATVGTLIIMPWRERAVPDAMNLWLAGTVVRLLLAPALTILLYSAAPLDAVALGLSVGFTYVATLLCEAALLARHLGRQAAAA